MSANDLVNSPIEVAGLVFDSRIRVGGAEYLEDVTGMSVVEWISGFAGEDGDQKMPAIKSIRILLTALYIQRNPDTDPKDAEARIKDLDVPSMMQVVNRMNAFDFDPKNSQTPEVDQNETQPAA